MIRSLTKPLRHSSIRQSLDRLRVSFWFAPLAMAVVSVLLVWIFQFIDAQIPNEDLKYSRVVLPGDTTDLRSILVGIATTTLATAGVVFSLLTIPLSTVASQYGSRLLRIYLRDRTTQVVLGIFTGTFCFCLFAALTLPPSDPLVEPPQLTISFALVLFLATFASLIALIHHITTMLQAPNIVAAAGEELRSVVHNLSVQEGLDNCTDQANDKLMPTELEQNPGYAIQAMNTGYIQSVDIEHLIHLAKDADLVIRLVRKPGNYVETGSLIALAWPGEHIDHHTAGRISRTFWLGKNRNPIQDVEYAVNQLAEVALRAMSPAINDPFTAMTCLDYIGTGLALFVENDHPRLYFSDGNGSPRLYFEPVKFSELLSAAFDMLRHASCDNVAVLLRILDAIQTIGQNAILENQRKELILQVERVLEESQNGQLINRDKAAIRNRCETLVSEFGRPIE